MTRKIVANIHHGFSYDQRPETSLSFLRIFSEYEYAFDRPNFLGFLRLLSKYDVDPFPQECKLNPRDFSVFLAIPDFALGMCAIASQLAQMVALKLIS